jgi:hypothetical protein
VNDYDFENYFCAYICTESISAARLNAGRSAATLDHLKAEQFWYRVAGCLGLLKRCVECYSKLQ